MFDNCVGGVCPDDDAPGRKLPDLAHLRTEIFVTSDRPHCFPNGVVAEAGTGTQRAHVARRRSPLAAYTPESLSPKSVHLFISLTARDVSLSAQTHDVHGYDHSVNAFGMTYQNALSYDAEDWTTADLKRLSLIEPLTPRPSASTN